MTIAIVVTVIVLVVFGALFGLRASTKAGMPSQDVLKRATERARELDAQEKREDD
jgi:hypothetical protein